MSSPLRVLHVYKDYFPPVAGGMEKHIHTLAHRQVQQGFEVTVLATNPAPFPYSLRTGVEQDGPVRVLRAGRLATVASTPLSPRQLLYQATLTADVAHLHFPYPPGEIANLLWGRARVTVITYHSDVVRQQRILRLYRPLLRRVLARADAIIVSSPAYARSSSELQAVARDVHPIPLGIELAPFLHVDRARAATIRERVWGREADVPLALFVGRLRYYKGLDVLLHALVQVPELHLWVIGTGPMGKPWRQLARRLGLDRRVVFLGNVPEADLPLYYAAADLFVLPSTSRAEAFGLVLVEAMASGLPVISTELGTGTSFVNVHGETGWVVPPGAPGALAEALNFLFSHPAERARMGRSARERARKEFDAGVMAERIAALYRQLLGP